MATAKRKPKAKPPAVVTPSEEGLTLKQQRFVDAYMGKGNCNGTKAARLAGYEGDEASMASTASRLLRNVKIAEAIKERLEHDPLVLNRAQRVRLLSRIATGEETETELSLSGDPVKRPPKIANRIAAVKLLGEMAGDTGTKVTHEHTGSIGLFAMSTAELNRELGAEDEDEGDE